MSGKSSARNKAAMKKVEKYLTKKDLRYIKNSGALVVPFSDGTFEHTMHVGKYSRGLILADVIEIEGLLDSKDMNAINSLNSEIAVGRVYYKHANVDADSAVAKIIIEIGVPGKVVGKSGGKKAVGEYVNYLMSTTVKVRDKIVNAHMKRGESPPPIYS